MRSAYCARVKECARLARIGQLQCDHPVAVRVGVDDLWFLLQRGIDLNDLTRHRREEIRHRLHGFDAAEGLAGLQDRAYFRQLQIHDIAELLLRIRP